MRILLLCLALCIANIAGAETVLMGAEDDWAPYSSIIKGEARGFAVDVIREAFAAVGLDVKFVVIPYVRCMAMAKRGELVGCFDAVPNQLIINNYLWHDKPLFVTRMNIYALADSKEIGLKAADLEGKTVGTTRDYEYGDPFDLNTKIVREVSNRNDQGFRKLLAGRMQYMAAEEKIAKLVFAKYPKEFAGKFKEVGTVDTPGLYIAFTKKSPLGAKYLEKFNQGYAIIVKNHKYRALEAAWF